MEQKTDYLLKNKKCSYISKAHVVFFLRLYFLLYTENPIGVKIKVDFSYKIKKGVQKKNENKIIKSNNNNINNNNDNIYDQNSKSNRRRNI